jgi:hypothetical protein
VGLRHPADAFHERRSAQVDALLLSGLPDALKARTMLLQPRRDLAFLPEVILP